MSIPKRYRGLIVVVAAALLLVLADKAFSSRLANFATSVVGDLIGEVAELAAPESLSRQTAVAPASPLWDGPRLEFQLAEFPAAFSAFSYGDQPRISLGTPLVLDLDSTRGHQRPGPRATASFQNPSASQRSMARQGMAGRGGPGSGGTSSGGGMASPMSAVAAIQEPQAEAAGAATLSADLTTAPVVESLETSLVAELWPQLRSGGGPGGAGGAGGAGGGPFTDPNQTGAEDTGAFGDTQYGTASPSDLNAPSSLAEALVLDSANGGPGLDVPTVLKVSAVLDVPGTAPSDLGLDWLGQLGAEDVLDLSPAALAGDSSSPKNAVSVLSEPAVMAVFGVGLLALAGRLRSRLRRAR